MLVYRIESEDFIHEFPPKGSLFAEGRWNRIGTWVVYTSESVSLAKLEVLANSGANLPSKVYRRTFNIQDDAPFIQINIEDLPPDWDQIPYPHRLADLIEEIRNEKKFLGCIVPSVHSHQEHNLLLFGDHPAFHPHVKELEAMPENFDHRLKG